MGHGGWEPHETLSDDRPRRLQASQLVLASVNVVSHSMLEVNKRVFIMLAVMGEREWASGDSTAGGGCGGQYGDRGEGPASGVCPHGRPPCVLLWAWARAAKRKASPRLGGALIAQTHGCVPCASSLSPRLTADPARWLSGRRGALAMAQQHGGERCHSWSGGVFLGQQQVRELRA